MTEKTIGKKRPCMTPEERSALLQKHELRAELRGELSKLEARDDLQTMHNLGNMNAAFLMLSEFKRVLILILKAVLE